MVAILACRGRRSAVESWHTPFVKVKSLHNVNPVLVCCQASISVADGSAGLYRLFSLLLAQEHARVAPGEPIGHLGSRSQNGD